MLFLLSLTVLLAAHHLSGWSLWWILIPILIFKFFIIYGAANIRSGFFIKSYSQGTTLQKEIAISFDDGPNPAYTQQVMELLAKYQVKASFFLIGQKVELHPEIVKQLYVAGHELGNHSNTHGFFIDFKNKNGFIKEIKDTDEKIQRLIGRKPLFFRPPYGVMTPHLAAASKELQKSVIGWNIRSFDTTSRSAAQILQNIRQQMRPGSILLFHDSSEKTLEVLEQTLIFAQENGFKIVSLEHLLSIPCYEN